MTDFKEKEELFNVIFAKQCSLINKSSKLFWHLHYLTDNCFWHLHYLTDNCFWHLHYLTDNCLSSVSFSQDSIAKIIQNVDPNKAHGRDNINIRMLKVCGSSIYKPLEMIFKQCTDTGVFLSEWKNGNIVPINKKGDK